MIRYLDGPNWRQMLDGALQHLVSRQETLNRINVFPVADGDTGTNMRHTLESAVAHVYQCADQDIGRLAAAASRGALLGARGNSGVLLSQLLRGIARGLAGKVTAQSGQLARGFSYGVILGYRAVSNPVEGTILTVARGIAREMGLAATREQDVLNLLRRSVDTGKTVLASTPELLPVLKKAGVVDAGGQGLLYILEGCLLALEGGVPAGVTVDQGAPIAAIAEGDTGYCTELLIQGRTNIQQLRRGLDALGQSVLVVAERNEVRVHLHTEHPGKALELCLQAGSLHQIKIDNLAEQTQAFAQPPTASQLVVAGASGELAPVFSSLGAQVVASVASMPGAGGAAVLLTIGDNQGAAINNYQYWLPVTGPVEAVAAALVFKQDLSPPANLELMRGQAAATRWARIEGTRGWLQDGQQVEGDDLCSLISKLLCKMVQPGDELLTVFSPEGSSGQAAELNVYLAGIYPQLELEQVSEAQPAGTWWLGLD